MPKIIELTFEINVEKVSCPGVWLCQDGLVSLTVFALGVTYQTCMLPPIFPLMYKDVFYFRKRFQETCKLSNIFCLLKDETIYCELVQWGGDCKNSKKCTVLAQYLGALNDVLFPPNMCSSDGVDLLMRRAKDFPGILAPKIEISTKVRIDEVYNQPFNPPSGVAKIRPCSCKKADVDPARTNKVCHTPLYHRVRHTMQPPCSIDSRSCSSLAVREPEINSKCSRSRSRTSILSSKHADRCRDYHQYHVYSVATPTVDAAWQWQSAAMSSDVSSEGSDCEYRQSRHSVTDKTSIEASPKPLLESRFIAPTPCHHQPLRDRRRATRVNISPCVCQICKRYYELFHAHPIISL